MTDGRVMAYTRYSICAVARKKTYLFATSYNRTDGAVPLTYAPLPMFLSTEHVVVLFVFFCVLGLHVLEVFGLNAT